MLVPAFGGCGINEEGGLSPDGGGGVGADGGIGGTNVGGGTCFPGAKVCPDPKTGDLVCLQDADPATGCKGTACAPCGLLHATAKCDASGACAIDKCDAGFLDCNNNPADGCEEDVQNNPQHCGDCATDCIATKGSNWICNAGVCEVTNCVPPTTGDCDKNKANGCEVDLTSDENHCGFCTNACALPNAASACSQGVCVVTTCNSGWANCDGNDKNGCETNIATDKSNCGACGKVCNGTNGVAGCAKGACNILCYNGFQNCDGNADTGCEVNVTNDPVHCGSCPNKCNPANAAAATCASGACGYTTCNGGFADCNPSKADGCEVNILQDKNNCGACGNVCPVPSGGTVFCANGSCAQNCGSLTLCGATCVNTNNDVNNCGSCGNVCPNGPANSTRTCSNKTCGWTCNTGFGKCGSACYVTATDKDHCGTGCVDCLPPANGTDTCVGGTCGISCNTGFTPCAGACVNTQTDNNNCGGCNTDCPTAGGKSCQGGQCKCSGTLTDCSGTCTDTSANNNACGATCVACTGGKTCQNGTCACPTATPTDCSGTCTNTTNNDAACGPSCTACTGGKTCQGTSCACPSANPDFCGSACTNDQTDKNNCGSCGNVCHSSASGCAGGNCTCASGQKYCDNTLGCKECCGPDGQQAECSSGQKCCSNVCKTGSC